MYVLPIVDSSSNSLTISRTLHNSTASLLLRLPGELRNQIYTYVFTDPRMFSSVSCASAMDVFGNCIDGPHLGLLATCRSIHAEAHMLPLKLNVFSFDTLVAFKDIVLRLTPSQREHITEVMIAEPSREQAWQVLEEMTAKGYSKLSDVLPNVHTVQFTWPRIGPRDPGMCMFAYLRARLGRMLEVSMLEQWAQGEKTTLKIIGK
jgi:hypothetical protein